MFDPGLITAGFLVGAIVGLTGVGSGTLMAPILVLVMDVRPLVAVGTNLAWGAITKAAGAWQHARQGTVDRALAFRLAIGSVPGSVIAAGLIGLIRANAPDTAEQTVGRAMAGAVLLVAMVLLAERRLDRTLARTGLIGATGRAGLNATLIGLGVGIVAGATSVGSGTLVAAALVLGTGLSTRRIVGTDVFHGAVLSLVAALAHLWAGYVDPLLLGSLLLGSIPGALLGSRLADSMPEMAMRPILAVALLASALRLFR